MSSQPENSLHNHYDQPHLITHILAGLQEAGLDLENLKCADLELLDEFHLRGKLATQEMAELLKLQKQYKVLDLGSGLGGPARFLAQNYGCQVSGLDLVTSYIEAANVLTKLTGLDDRVDFKQGDMSAIPFEKDSFDCIWSQHTVMNVADKAALAAEVKRVLKPGGKAAFYEICSASGQPVHLPVAWASTPEHSHLCTADELRKVFSDSGLVPGVWEDLTRLSLDWMDGMVGDIKNRTPKTQAWPGLGLVMGENAALKSRNLNRNLREGRIEVIRAVFTC